MAKNWLPGEPFTLINALKRLNDPVFGILGPHIYSGNEIGLRTDRFRTQIARSGRFLIQHACGLWPIALPGGQG